MRCLLLAGLLALSVLPGRADSIASARLAQARLGPTVWSRVIRIENSRPDPHHPKEFAALVFAVEDRLWLYNPYEGTQSLSLLAGHLSDDEADPGPLLRAALPGLRRWVAFSDPPSSAAAKDAAKSAREATLPFGCFIECYCRWRELVASGRDFSAASVLVFYFDTSIGPVGHSVLLLQTATGRLMYDPNENATMPVGTAGASALEIARTIFALENPFRAHLLELHPPETAASNRMPSGRHAEM
ncbi:MAG TPA: hypothetical protein VHD76_08535 [Bryobacteraceae bacterium]|nr:hypothetical protein [Bryobacteraceae bacterium]